MTCTCSRRIFPLINRIGYMCTDGHTLEESDMWDLRVNPRDRLRWRRWCRALRRSWRNTGVN
ncbi:MAG: hypothetical protein NVSMB64_26220 [Candidatus Velthaea sp.]